MNAIPAPSSSAPIPVRARTRYRAAADESESTLQACALLAAAAATGGTVLVQHSPRRAGLPESVFFGFIDSMGGYVVESPDGSTVTTRSTAGRLTGVIDSIHGAGPLTPLIITLACLADSRSELTDVSHCPDLITQLRRMGADIDVDGPRIRITPAELSGGSWSGVDWAVTLCGLVLQLRVPDLDVDLRGLAPEHTGFLTEWNRVLHADEYLLPGSAKLPHDYL